MAIATDNQLVQSDLKHALHVFWEDLKESRAKRRVFRDTLNELNSLSGRELSDLGLNRSMLKRIAYESAYGVDA